MVISAQPAKPKIEIYVNIQIWPTLINVYYHLFTNNEIIIFIDYIEITTDK